jgi:hypothetical protein
MAGRSGERVGAPRVIAVPRSSRLAGKKDAADRPRVIGTRQGRVARASICTRLGPRDAA